MVEKKQPEKELGKKEASKRIRNLPGSSWHRLAPVAAHAHFLLPHGLGPEALGGRSMAGAGIRCRLLVLLALGHEFVHKFRTGLGAQGRHALVDL
jgi:hypothetical protein